VRGLVNGEGKNEQDTNADLDPSPRTRRRHSPMAAMARESGGERPAPGSASSPHRFCAFASENAFLPGARHHRDLKEPIVDTVTAVAGIAGKKTAPQRS
jgi:hypothetical protein